MNPAVTHRAGLQAIQSLVVALLLVSSALITSGDAWGATLKPTSKDLQVIEQVIRHQIDALARDDAKSAFAYASPSVRELFSNADAFLQMVREQYPAVYRPASVEFVDHRVIAGKVVELVRFAANDGKVWIAAYEMEQQPDRTWKISGCQIEVTNALTT